MRIAALVPMRHFSRRVPGKNYRPFAGRPLYQHIVESLLAVRHEPTVVIDTDSPTILADARATFPAVVLIERAAHLRGEMASMMEILRFDAAQVEADLYLQTHSTNPLLRTQTIEAAIDRFLEVRGEHDSLFGVTRIQTRLWDTRGRPINHDLSELLRTQDLPPVWMENSNLYIFTRESIEKHRNRIGARPYMFEIGREESWDIDEDLDLRISEFLFIEKARTT